MYNKNIMVFKVLKSQLLYNDCPIVIRQIGNQFEYITCIYGEIYSSYSIITKPLFRKLFFMDYTKEQYNAITQHLIAQAQATINYVQNEYKDSPKPKT